MRVPQLHEIDTRLQLDALYHLAVELSGLRSVDQVLETALRQCLTLTGSQFGFIGLCGDDPTRMEIAAILGFHPTPEFYETHRYIPLRPNVFANAVLESRAVRSVDARTEPGKVGQPPGHPEVRTFLGVPLRLQRRPIGMIGVANRSTPYEDGHERLMLTYAAQIAIVIRNAQLYESLARSNERLERIVDQRTAQLRKTSRELAEKAAELQQVLSETVDAQEQERQRIARDIHDGINQLLVGAMLELTAGLRRLERGELSEAKNAVEEAQQVLREVESEIRRVVLDLHPPLLEGLGLPAALRRLCDEFAAYSDVECQLRVDGEAGRLSERSEIGLYRICQEALSNVAAHAQASRVEVRVDFGASSVRLLIVDDGNGFDPATVSPDRHLGLRSMRYRAESVGGTFRLVSAAGRGTRVEAFVPLG